MTFRVNLTSEAETNLQETVAWLQMHSPIGARNWLNAARAAIESLRSNPHRNSVAPESRFAPHEMRQVFFKTRRGLHYRAIYFIENETVWVTHIRAPRQRLLGSGDFGNPSNS